MTVTHRLQAPLRRADLEPLQAGDLVLFSGTVYTARDAAHKRLVEAIDQGDPLPMDLNGQIIYYVGPTPARPERVIGAAGPTTSYRMDAYTEALLKLGLKVMIGKGRRSEEVKKGAGALLSLAIKSVEVIAYPDLGPEAVRKLTVEDFPATVINDLAGRDLYEEGKKRYKKGNKQ
ncbi:MAG: fumarate hydratase C-terminal domain-containing protein [Deltaproteobacteria bacterium]|nr:fumarate hydratase C-terminal domain-containing protein [Deltaproteobacteria bacterium]